jgi:hypothetical protein
MTPTFVLPLLIVLASFSAVLAVVKILVEKYEQCSESGKAIIYDVSNLDVFYEADDLTIANGSILILKDIVPPWKV